MSAVGQRLAQRQGHTLVMTPQLRRSLQLLEMSSLALRDLIERELDQNPVLERADGDDDDQGGGATRKSPRPKPAPSSFGRDIDRLGLWPGGPGDSRGRSDADGRVHKRDGTKAMARAATAETDGQAPADLTAHLLEQINIDLTDPTDRKIAMLLLEQLDESGYLTGDIEQVRRRAGCDAARIEATLTRLRQFDPPGLFARNLAECLAAQLRERGRLTDAMARLLDHLDLLAKGDRKRLMTSCGVDADELSRMIAEIRTLNPRPASSFNAEAATAIVPDVVVRPGTDGGWVVEAQSEHWPRLLVKDGYVARLRGAARDKTTRDYITEKLAAANWLLRSLRRREETIVKVATAIAHHQDGFLRDGVARLRALTRRDLAKSIGLHESTVSRVSANKFMATPRGTYPFGFFFGGALAAGATSPGHAAAVRTRIRAIIDGESHDEVLSDQHIAQLLRAEDIRIARRTVAKYRKSLRIPASPGRRRGRRLHGS